MAYQYISETTAEQTWRFNEAQIRTMREALAEAIAAKKAKAEEKGEPAYTYMYEELNDMLRKGLLEAYKSMKFHAQYRLEDLEAETADED